MNRHLFIFLTGFVGFMWLLLFSFNLAAQGADIIKHSQAVPSPATSPTPAYPEPDSASPPAEQIEEAEVSAAANPCVASSASYRCTIVSTKAWQKTSLTVKKGEQFAISYVSGSWTVDFHNWPYVMPDGYPPQVDSQIWSGCKVSAAYPYAMLLGYLNKTKIFAVGLGGTFTAQDKGTLYLQINDKASCLNDNDGSIILTVGRSSPSTVQFSATNYSVRENDGVATIGVTLSGASSQSVGVNYASSNGTARAGSDYVATSGTLVFNPGVTSQSFSIPILNDTTKETNETVKLKLSNVSNAILGTQSSTTLTIADDDNSTATCEYLVGTGANIRLVIVPAGFDDRNPQDVEKFNRLAGDVANAFINMQPYVSNLNKFSIWKANNYIGKNVNVQSGEIWYNQTLIDAAKVCNYNQILVIAHNSGWAGGTLGYYSVIGSGTPPTCDPATCTGTACPQTASCSWDESIKYSALHETGHTFADLGHTCSLAAIQTPFDEIGRAGDFLLAAVNPPNCGIQFSGNPNVACTEWQSAEFQRWVLPGDPIFGCYAGCSDKAEWYRPWDTSINLMCRDDGLQHGFTPVDRRLLEIILQRQNAVASISTDGDALVVNAYSNESTMVDFNAATTEQQNVAVITFPSGAFSETTQLLYTPLNLSSGDEPSISPPALYAERIFHLTGLWPKATYPTESQPASLQPGQSYTVTLTYDPAMLPEGVEETMLSLYAWDEATKTWVAETASILDPDANTITASFNHFGVWAVLGSRSEQDKSLYLPFIIR